MTSKTSWLLRATGLLACLCVPLMRAQSESAPASVTITFRLLAWDANVPAITYETAGREISLRLQAFYPSDDQQYTGPATLEFYRRDNDGKRVTTGTAALPPKSDRVLVILFPKGDGTYRVACVPDDATSFPLGRVRLYNGTPWPLAIKTTNGIIQMEPNSFRLVPASGNSFHLRIAYNVDGRWKKGGGNVFADGPAMRQNILFLAGQAGESYPVQIITLPDQGAPKPPQNGNER